MGNLRYIIVITLIIAWAIAVIGYGTGGLIHILLVIAIIGHSIPGHSGQESFLNSDV